MAGRKRNDADREVEFFNLVKLYLRGNSHADIARSLNVSGRQLQTILRKVHRQWVDQYLTDCDVQKSRELAKIDHLESAAWAGWEKSLEEAYSKEAQMDGTDKRAKSTVKNQAGDSQFLKQVAWCITKRCEILGLETPSGIDATADHKQMSHDELLDLIRSHGMDSPQWSQRLLENARLP